MKKILIVEDEAEIRKLERSILESAEYEVDEAQNAEEALVKLIKNKYDLILSDIMMPGIDGYELCKFLSERKEVDGKTTPVVMVSAKSDPEDMAKGFDSGAVTFLVKPFTAGSLLISVQTAIPSDTD